MSTNPARFVWYDLMTSDTKAAEAFYKSVIGWEAQSMGAPDRPYTVFSVGQGGVAGLMPLPEDARAAGAPPCWTGYVWVDDVDAWALRVKAAGGAVRHAGQDIPGIGRFAVVADPHGAVFILFKDTGGPQRPQAAAGTPGHIGWHELHAGDGVSAFAFYSGLFGWTGVEAMDMGPMGVYQIFATGGDAAVGGMMTQMPDSPGPCWRYYFNVEAIDAAVARTVAGGGRLVMGPQQVPGGSWIVQCIDPQGGSFAMVAAKR